jgi:8-oxoguanine deaminase
LQVKSVQGDGRKQVLTNEKAAVSNKAALWIKDPLAILADGAERGVVVKDGRIVELVPAGGTPATPDAAIFEAGGHVVVPGLINTHHHFYQTLTRAAPAALYRELFPWLQALYPIWAGLTPESLELAVTVAMAELLLSGCSTTTDHHYVFPAGLESAIDIEIAAARRLGIRVVLTRGSMNLSQRDGGLPPDAVVQDADTILADSKRLIDRYHQRADDAMVQIALAPCSPFSVTTALMRSTAELAAQENVRLHTHLAETEDENRFCQELYGCRPLDYLDNCGWLGERTWLAHGVHFNTDEIRRLALARTTVSHCACSNQTLASGCCPVCDMEAASAWASTARRPTMPLISCRRCALRSCCSAPATASPRSATATHCAGQPRARRLASAALRSARSRSARRPISRSSSSMSCGFPATAIHSPRWCCAALTRPTG